MADKDSFSFEIKTSVGEISKSSKGWTKELNLVSWNGQKAKYDIIIGKVANDKVFRVVDLYHSGIWDKERALKEIRVYPGYDQIAFITQKAIDQALMFSKASEVEL